MFRSLLFRPSCNRLFFPCNTSFLSTAATSTHTNSSAPSSPAITNTIIEAGKRNIGQSPLKIKFLVSLIQGQWVPDALAQLKFSPKHRATDVAKILNRAVSLAKIYHNYIAEELIVKEVIVTKGIAIKRMRIMGRGRTGFGYNRSAHVLVKVAPIDFSSIIKGSRDIHDRSMWKKRKGIAEKIKKDIATGITATKSVVDA